MEPSWQIISDVLILLVAALLLGTLAEQLRQSAILGYLLAGMIVGPKVLGFVGSSEQVEVIAELGVALLLFTIGLEFSIRRLRRLGTVALLGGSLQVVITLLAAAALAMLMGLDPRASLAVGAIVALSSTACVLRVLVDRTALDSIYGRNALGILLLQDVAVIPLMLMMAALSGSSLKSGGLMLLRTVALGAVLIGLFYFLFNLVVPRLLHNRRWVVNRELPILLAIVVALGAVVAAHRVEISPAMVAFIAGVLLGESPFAVQIRADVSSVRTLLLTVFFASIGLMGDPIWVMDHWILVAGTVAAIVVGKVLIISTIVRLLRMTAGLAVATGLCLAQVGEFSFVLAAIAHPCPPLEDVGVQLINEDIFNLIISAMIVTLFLTPLLVTAAPHAVNWIEVWCNRRTTWKYSRSTAGDRASTRFVALETERSSIGPPDERDESQGKIFIIGFGPAGQSVAQALLSQHRQQIIVIDLNARNTAMAQGQGLAAQLGDASHRDVLEHAQIHRAGAIVITVPDPQVSRTIIYHCKYLAPSAAIVVRSRYHVLVWELQSAGALEVVDEEENVGLRLAAETRKHVRIEGDQ